MASLEPRADVLGGACEVDGSYFGRKRYGKQKLVAGVTCKAKTKKVYCIRLKIVHRRDRDTAEEFIEEMIKRLGFNRMYTWHSNTSEITAIYRLALILLHISMT